MVVVDDRVEDGPIVWRTLVAMSGEKIIMRLKKDLCLNPSMMENKNCGGKELLVLENHLKAPMIWELWM